MKLRKSLFYLAIIYSWNLIAAPTGIAQQPDSIVVYKSINEIDLELHLFIPDNRHNNESKSAIIFFHGGGWKSGDPSQFYPQSQYLSNRGMIAVSAEYRIENKHNTTPKEAVSDAKSAIQWVRDHANQLGINPGKIAAGGGSAGGHIAAAAGTIQHFADPQNGSSVSSKPDALVLFNPVFDNSPSGYGYDRVKTYWQSISPMHNIDETTPPTILFFGTEDHLVPVDTINKYKKLMDTHGVRCDLHLYEGFGHAFFNVDKYKETLYETDRFLESLGYLEGNPTLD